MAAPDNTPGADPDDHAQPHWHYTDFGWGRNANPNTADGELQNMRAFGSGIDHLPAGQRSAARVVVWLILLGFAIAIGYCVAAIVRLW